MNEIPKPNDNLQQLTAGEIKFIQKKGVETERLQLGTHEALRIAGISNEAFENKNFISQFINKYRYVKISDK